MPRSTTLAEAVADALRQSLSDGVYHCGERLAEITLSHEMNVSQTTIRDALNILEREGWLVKRARYGFTVRNFTPAEVEELYTLWLTLEQLALRWTVETIRTEDEVHLSQTLAEAQLQVEMNNVRGAREAVVAFHLTLVSIAERPHTAMLVRTIINQARLLENLRSLHNPHTPYTYAEILAAYSELLKHIRYRDVEAAQATLRRVITADCKSLLVVLDLIA